LGGTWIHETLILKLASFLNTAFEIQCHVWVSELLRTGKVEIIKPKELSRKEILELALQTEEENEKLKLVIEYHAPKVQAHDLLMESGNAIDMEATAKTFGIGRTTFIKKLKALKILTTSGLPSQNFLNEGYFRVKQVLLPNKRMYSQVFTTSKGLGFLSKKIAL